MVSLIGFEKVVCTCVTGKKASVHRRILSSHKERVQRLYEGGQELLDEKMIVL